MSILKVYLHPDDVLRVKSAPVTAVTDEIRQLLDDMLETMYAARGIGLAAPQVGIGLRVIVMNVTRDEEGEPVEGTPYKMVNPEIIWKSEETVPYEEGCLSIPGVSAEVERPAEVEVRYRDERGDMKTLRASGLLATCVQHEVDHLDGVLFFDHLSRLKRQNLLKKYKKYLESRVERDHVL